MLIGKAYNTLDSQRRVTLPKQLRSQLGSQPILTRGLDGGIFLFPESYWTAVMNNLEQQTFTHKRSRDFWRYLSNDAFAVIPDSLGRVTIPEDLASSAHLNKDVVVVGSLQYIEIWDRDRYHTYLDSLAKNAEEIAEGLEWETHARAGIEN